MSKYQLKKSSIYYRGTDVPVNKIGIKDSEKIHLIEKNLLNSARTFFISELSDETLFDESYFKILHQNTFESLYDWAGKYRNFDMAKGDSRFCQGEFVANESKKIFSKLVSENYLKECSEIPVEAFAKKLAYYQGELIMIHPFYELNGRITRLFFDLIAMYNGYKPINYRSSLPNEYIEASIECVQFADSSLLEAIIKEGLEKL